MKRLFWLSDRQWELIKPHLPYRAAGRRREDDRADKEKFVHGAINTFRPRRIADLGCNTGDYSLLAAKSCEQVFALDSDAASIDVLYRRIQSEN